MYTRLLITIMIIYLLTMILHTITNILHTDITSNSPSVIRLFFRPAMSSTLYKWKGCDRKLEH